MISDLLILMYRVAMVMMAMVEAVVAPLTFVLDVLVLDLVIDFQHKPAIIRHIIQFTIDWIHFRSLADAIVIVLIDFGVRREELVSEEIDENSQRIERFPYFVYLDCIFLISFK